MTQQVKFERQIAVLTFQKASLRRSLYESQRIIAAKSDSISVMIKELKLAKVKAMRSKRFAGKLGVALANCLTVQASQEKSCKERILYLEQFAAKRDNALVFYKRIVSKRKNMLKERVLKIKYLTNRLHTVFLLQQYKIKQKIAVKRSAIGVTAPIVK